MITVYIFYSNLNPIRNYQKKGKNSQKYSEKNYEGGNATLRPEGGKAALPPTKRELGNILGMTRDVIGFKME